MQNGRYGRVVGPQSQRYRFCANRGRELTVVVNDHVGGEKKQILDVTREAGQPERDVSFNGDKQVSIRVEPVLAANGAAEHPHIPESSISGQGENRVGFSLERNGWAVIGESQELRELLRGNGPLPGLDGSDVRLFHACSVGERALREAGVQTSLPQQAGRVAAIRNGQHNQMITRVVSKRVCGDPDAGQMWSPEPTIVPASANRARIQECSGS